MSEPLTRIYNQLTNNFWLNFDKSLNDKFYIVSAVVLILFLVTISISQFWHKKIKTGILAMLLPVCGIVFITIAIYQNYHIRNAYRTATVETAYQKQTEQTTKQLYTTEKAKYNLNAVKTVNSSQLSDKKLNEINNQLTTYQKSIKHNQHEINKLWTLQQTLNEHPKKEFIKNVPNLRTKYPTYQIYNANNPVAQVLDYNNIPFEINQSGDDINVIHNLDSWQARRYTDAKLQTQFKHQFNIK